MLTLSAEETRNVLPFDRLIEALRSMFKAGCVMPLRHHHQMEVPGEETATLLLMPAWLPGAYSGVKIVNVVPGNSARGLPAVAAQYLLSDGRTGEMLALVDGGELTARRTAAASALAAGYLARKDASHLVVAGTGRVAVNLAAAHKAVRPIEKVTVWGRSLVKAEAAAAEIASACGVETMVSADLESAVKTADIVSAATLSQKPLILGAWLQPGTHVDLIGAFRPDMRESDDEAVRRSSVFADTREGAGTEGGDLAQPLASGVLKPQDVLADLYDLCRNDHPGRRFDGEITLFKSVGAALEDLAGAVLAYETAVAERRR
ncbi:ornithine cyclodeaminase family protein [Roseibium litorale]|uniref:Ornithine cyclodeaminase family protein n=1 Tax=Roseibium litorale TaxID=2803841 RepID=A0ABR9CGD6_9HYPH|nr:ornithine cyclodeaminase family protein [Roseibium litorale]MBD8889969.1 ornithine cyclodeaminase family protein [Roseibium litorale]